MTLEELWQLFPITLVPHRPEWKEWARAEIAGLEKLLEKFRPVINHIGSTAIPDIKAKPIVDLLVELPPDADRGEVRDLIEAEGYICMAETTQRMSFNKGYTPAGYAEKVFHIHIHETGDNDEIRFRDLLITNPPVAREYEALKLSLLPRYRNDRDAYTAAKTPFITRILTTFQDQFCMPQDRSMPNGILGDV